VVARRPRPTACTVCGAPIGEGPSALALVVGMCALRGRGKILHMPPLPPGLPVMPFGGGIGVPPACTAGAPDSCELTIVKASAMPISHSETRCAMRFLPCNDVVPFRAAFGEGYFVRLNPSWTNVSSSMPNSLLSALNCGPLTLEGQAFVTV
jgi:hypothetical protein